MTTLVSDLRALRLARDLTQERLAELVGLSRQAVGAIERGESVPSVEVGLRLASVLGVPVETLFRLTDPPEPLSAVAAADLSGGSRVRVVPVGGTPVAVPVGGPDGPGGLAECIVVGERDDPPRPAAGDAAEPRTVRLRPLDDEAPGAPGALRTGDSAAVVLVGCDPATALLRDLLMRRRGIDLLWHPASSRRALELLGAGLAHVAGFHLKEAGPGAGASARTIRARLPFPSTVVTFAVWEQGLLVEPGNPRGVTSPGDLARPELRLVNREDGSGSRAVLDRALAAAGIPTDRVRGYGTTRAPGHWAVAQAVAAGTAQVGVGIRAAAVAFGLHWIPLEEERYDLVVPDHLLDAPAVSALLDLLASRELRRQVTALGGYDVTPMGRPA